MKKLLLILALPLMYIVALQAQTTQEQADEIVLEYLSDETADFTLYYKAGLQTEGFKECCKIPGFDYPCWVYFVQYAETRTRTTTTHKYLIVKESNGDVVEVKTKNSEGQGDLADWRILLPREIPFEDYSLTGTSCKWKELPTPPPYSAYQLVIINSNEELENNMNCINENSYPEIDFSKHTLLLVRGVAENLVFPNYKNLQQLSAQSYVMKVNLLPTGASVITYWQVPIIVNKIVDDSVIELIVTKNW
jgi:hypothetical protein